MDKGTGANDRAVRGGNSAKVSGGHVRLGQLEAVPVSVDQAIQVSVLDEVWVDHGDLLEPGAREAFEDDRTDAARPDDADVGASQACLCVDAPTVDGAYEAWTAGVRRMRARSPIRSGASRPDPSNVRAVGGREPARPGFLPEPGAPDAVRAHRQAEQRQARLSNEGCDDVALGVVIHVAQGLPAGTGMAVKDGDARVCPERTIEDAVEVSAVHGDVAVQIPVAVFGQDDVGEDSRIAVESVAAVPERETSLLLQPTAAQPAQEVIRKLAVERFAQYDTMVQRALQIRRMCLSR